MKRGEVYHTLTASVAVEGRPYNKNQNGNQILMCARKDTWKFIRNIFLWWGRIDGSLDGPMRKRVGAIKGGLSN